MFLRRQVDRLRRSSSSSHDDFHRFNLHVDPTCIHFSLAPKALDLLHSPKRRSSLFHTSIPLHTLLYNPCCSDHTNCNINFTQHQVIVSHFLTIANKVAASFPLHFTHYPAFHTLAKPSVTEASKPNCGAHSYRVPPCRYPLAARQTVTLQVTVAFP